MTFCAQRDLELKQQLPFHRQLSRNPVDCVNVETMTFQTRELNLQRLEELLRMHRNRPH